MIFTCAFAATFFVIATLVGRAVIATLRPADVDRRFLAATAPLVGVATLLAVADLVELWLPLREGAWGVALVVGLAVVQLCRTRTWVRPTLTFGDAVVVLVAIAAGALPTALVGRATTAALTNDDATFYLATAERLVAHPWLEHPGDGTGVYCFSEFVIHGWLWRTGVANLTALVIVWAHVDGTVAIAIVTSVLMGLVGQSALAMSVAFGVPPRPVWARSSAAIAVVLSAAPIFLAWQHLLGQLVAFSLFPAALACLARAARRGGASLVVPAALLVGATMNGFADAAPLMVLGVGPILLLGGARDALVRVARVGGALLLATIIFALTFWRAAWAAYGTVTVRAPAEVRGLFLQPGWLVRSPFDDLATLFGVDPWPPWPAPWPPNGASVVEYASIAAALALAVAAIYRFRRRPGVIAAAGSLALLVIVMIIVVANRYLRAKSLLLEASLVIPTIAAVTLRPPRRTWVVALFCAWVAGGVLALAQLARASRFHVVDAPDHDRLEGALARIAPGSLFALDGFGAPSDVVHDEHRAMRAAHANGLVPIQPGLDGGFFKLACEDPKVRTVPNVGWALQRAGSETVSGGEVVEQFGRFTLRRVDLSREDGVLGAWAPTHGWARAESEADGTVFRWAESLAAGTLRVVNRSTCGRLAGDVRSVAAEGSYSVTIDGTTMSTEQLTPVWTRFETNVFSARDAVSVSFRAFVGEHDESHAIALRKLVFLPDPTCTSALTKFGEGARAATFPDGLGDTNTYVIVPANGVRCGRVIATVDAPDSGGLMIVAGSDRTFTAVSRGRTDASSLRIDFGRVGQISIARVVDGGPLTDWHVAALRVRQEPCDNEPP